MRMIVCTKYGSPEVLKFKEADKPVPGDDEVLIKLKATTVTAADFRIRSFTIPSSYRLLARFALGFNKPRQDILGMEFSGEIESRGKNVNKFQKGDYVTGSTGHHMGTYAEYFTMPVKDSGVAIAEKPGNLTGEDSAAIAFGGLTALFFLRKANIKKGQKVLIYGASGSVGTYAVQLAKHFGAEVTGVCSTSNLELVQSLGADKVIDYTKENFIKNDEKYDVIFEAVGKALYSDCIKSLKKRGILLHAVATPGVSLKMFWTSLTTRKKTVGGELKLKSEDLTYLKELIEADKIKPVIDRYYSFEQMVEAHRYVDKGHKKGNVVICINNTN